MSAMKSIDTVYGEDLDALISVIADLQYRRYGRDRVQISTEDLPVSRVAPLVRALMRAEAEILLDEADIGEETDYPAASEKERHGEAFGRVFRSVGLAEGERDRRQ